MEKSKEERIRERAHEIWESKGRPHGDHEADWHQAAREIEEGDREPTGSAPQVAGKAGPDQKTDEGPLAGTAESGVRGNERTATAGAPASTSPASKAR
jgi:Protein of unknown function (DUF2934)